MEKKEARIWVVSGRVQGVGYRNHVAKVAGPLGVTGYAKNLADGRVEVFACGPREALEVVSGAVRQGPRWADVRAVDERKAGVARYDGFDIR